LQNFEKQIKVKNQPPDKQKSCMSNFVTVYKQYFKESPNPILFDELNIINIDDDKIAL